MARLQRWGGPLLSAAKAQAVLAAAVTSVGVRAEAFDLRRLQEQAAQLRQGRQQLGVCRRRLAELATGNAVVRNANSAEGVHSISSTENASSHMDEATRRAARRSTASSRLGGGMRIDLIARKLRRRGWRSNASDRNGVKKPTLKASATTASARSPNSARHRSSVIGSGTSEMSAMSS